MKGINMLFVSILVNIGLILFIFSENIYFNIYNWEVISAIANFGLLLVGIITFSLAYFEYRKSKNEQKYIRTVNLIGRYTGQGGLQPSQARLMSQDVSDPQFFLSKLSVNIDVYNELLSVFSYYEELGIYVNKDLVDFELISEFFMYDIPVFFEKYKSVIFFLRNRDNLPEIFSMFEELNKRIITERDF